MTLKFIRLPIAAKAVLLIAALGILSAIANWLCLKHLYNLDQGNSIAAGQVASARLALAEAKTAIEALGAATYKTYSAANIGDAREYGATIDDEYKVAKNSLDNVLTYDPASLESIQVVIQKLELAHVIAIDLKKAVVAGDRAAASQMLDAKFDPARDDVAFHLNRLINILGGEAREATANASELAALTLRITILILIGGTIAIVGAALTLAHFSIARPLRRMAETMTATAAGNLGIAIDGQHRSDEIGAMARAVRVFHENGVALDEAQRLRSVEQERAERDKRQALDKASAEFETKMSSVAGVIEQAVSELDTFSRAMMAVADEAQRHASGMVPATSHTTEDAVGVAAAIEELSHAIGEINAQVANATGVVTEASRCANQAMTNASTLVSTVKDIDDVVAMIAAIAGKTNLLALNATIEAARAGSAGRGFAVVAHEVKALAAQTAAALAEIKGKTSLVNQIIPAVKDTSQAMLLAIRQVERISAAITVSVGQQDLAARTIAKTVDGSAALTRDVSSSVSAVSKSVEQTARAAHQVAEAAAELHRQAATLTQDARLLTSEVRAA